eukprot:TRINITY_DN14757_c0_g1_i1.p1 TRINITY_DN14757_c0_g1~~TRINITY_DN14757_c0_g1_i1.p1  ORF type:complete len:114 (+),score=35.65 TRINITY_DN14757_c0_g1_i1:129-470(+)
MTQSNVEKMSNDEKDQLVTDAEMATESSVNESETVESIPEQFQEQPPVVPIQTPAVPIQTHTSGIRDQFTPEDRMKEHKSKLEESAENPPPKPIRDRLCESMENIEIPMISSS